MITHETGVVPGMGDNGRMIADRIKVTVERHEGETIATVTMRHRLSAQEMQKLARKLAAACAGC
jgi:F0F1-type ATP synthase delta subunit